MKKALLLVPLLASTLAACADPSDPSPPPGADPTGIAWELESGSLDGGPIPIVASHPITLSFSEEGAGGTAACNGYGASYAISGTGITFSDLVWTEMACMPEETMESERLYLEALPRIEDFSMSVDHLTLTGDAVQLVFLALPPVPTSELTGTVWVLDSLIRGDAVSSVSGERATLELFSDGSMLGSTGCRSLNGRYVVTGAEVLMTDMAAEGECPVELRDQDDLVVTVLGDGFRAAIDGDTLTLTASGDQGLVYKAET
ncbi:MAG: META domain-containing protein [Acidimicrobiia bacterium]